MAITVRVVLRAVLVVAPFFPPAISAPSTPDEVVAASAELTLARAQQSAALSVPLKTGLAIPAPAPF